MTEPEYADCTGTELGDLTTPQGAGGTFVPGSSDGKQRQASAEADLISTSPIYRAKLSSRRTVPTLSASRLAFYLLVSTVVASILLQLITDDETVIFFGTLNLAIISAWMWAWLRKIRSTLQYFRDTQQSRPEGPLPGESGNA